MSHVEPQWTCSEVKLCWSFVEEVAMEANISLEESVQQCRVIPGTPKGRTETCQCRTERQRERERERNFNKDYINRIMTWKAYHLIALVLHCEKSSAESSSSLHLVPHISHMPFWPQLISRLRTRTRLVRGLIDSHEKDSCFGWKSAPPKVLKGKVKEFRIPPEIEQSPWKVTWTQTSERIVFQAPPFFFRGDILRPSALRIQPEPPSWDEFELGTFTKGQGCIAVRTGHPDSFWL